MNPLIRYVCSMWIWLISGLVILIWVPILTAIHLFDRDPLARPTARSLRALGRTLVRVHCPGLEISGLDNIKPGQVYLVVVNHQSTIDVPLVSFVPLDSKFIGREDLFKVPYAGLMLRMSKDIPVDRKNARDAARALMQCAAYLRKGCSVLVFAEGTRSPDGELLPFAKGPFSVAVRERVPILPVVIDGTGAMLPKNAMIFRKRHQIFLKILPPVSVEGWTVQQANDLRDLVRSQIGEALAGLRA